MKKIILSFFWMTTVVITQAQFIGTKTINTTGSTASGGGLILEWSVGEMVAVQTLISPNVILTQGLLQPGASSNAPLPVTLLFFKAKAVNGQALLSWATSQEINNHHFDVERSSNGVDFQIFKQVPGAGNSDIPKTYSLIDLTPYPSTYYRLKQVDADGRYNYSSIVQVQFSRTLTYGLYPNPTKGALYLSLNGDHKTVEVIITDVSGKNVLRKILNPTNTIQMNLSHLPNGSYFIKVQNGAAVWSAKFLKQ